MNDDQPKVGVDPGNSPPEKWTGKMDEDEMQQVVSDLQREYPSPSEDAQKGDDN